MRVATLLLAFVFMIACGKNSSSKPGTTVVPPSGKADHVDITDAMNLFVTSGDAKLNLADGLEPGTLYKTTAEGVVKEVTYTLAGQTITHQQVPTAINAPDPSVVVMDYGTSSNYFVNKETGKAYVTDGLDLVSNVVAAPASTGLHLAGDAVKMYGLKSATETKVLASLSFDGENLVIQDLSATGDNVVSFTADKDGNIVYKGADTALTGIGGFKLRTAAGKFSKLNDIACASTAVDGRIFGYVSTNASSYSTIKKIVNAVTGETIKDLSNGEFTTVACGDAAARVGTKRVNRGAIGTGESPFLEIFDESTATFEKMAIDAELDKKQDLVTGYDNYDLKASDKYAYGVMGSKVAKIDLTAKTLTKMDIPNLLEVKSFEVSKDDVITLKGTLDDGNEFVGTISAAGALNVISKTGAGAVTILKPLN